MSEAPQNGVVRKPRPLNRQEKMQIMMDSMRPVSALEIPRKVNMMFYGAPGAHKTVTACRIGAHRGRVVLHEMNHDHLSLHKFPELAKKVDVIHYTSPVQLKLLAKMAENGDFGDEVKTIVVDTIDGWCDKFIYEIVNKVTYEGSKGSSNSRTTIQPRQGVEGASDLISDFGLTVAELADFNMVKLNLGPIINQLCRSKYNIIINAHARKTDKDKSDDWMHIRPDMPEQAYKTVLEDLDALGFFLKNPNGTVSVRFDGGRGIDTKSRIQVVEGKTFPKTELLADAINNFLDGK